MDFEKLVSDWGGFERLVAKLHETGDVTVERDVILPGRSGAPRQIDVLIRHRQGFYEHLVIVECKYWQDNVERLHVDALSTTIREVGADKGVIFSKKGFQSGAIAQAKAENIDLFVIRDLGRREWGEPGRIIDLFLQFAQLGLGGVEARGYFLPSKPGAVPDPSDLHLDLRFAEGKALSATGLIRSDGRPSEVTLEDRILQGLEEGTQNAQRHFPLFNSGASGDYYLGIPITLNAQEPFRIQRTSGVLLVPSIRLNAALKITQSRITVDRGRNLEFALAVESRVTGKVSLASRAIGTAITNLSHLRGEFDGAEDPFKNGQVIQVLLNGYFDMSETNGKNFVPLESVSQPFNYVDPNDV